MPEDTQGQSPRDMLRLDVPITREAYEMVRQLIERRWPGRHRMAGAIVEEAIRRLYEAEGSTR